MNSADEIEYFEFVPVSFVKEVHTEILKKIEQRIGDVVLHGACSSVNKKHASEAVASSLSRNFFFFQNFVVKTVFAFPKDFNFERKVTDMRCEANLQKLVDELLQITEEEKYLRSETLRLEGEIEAEFFRTAQYERLLGGEKEITDAIKSARTLQETCEETLRMYQNFVEAQTGREDEEKDMIEFKGLRNEMYRKERDDLYHKASLDVLMFYAKNLAN